MHIKILRRLILGFILSILIFFSHPQFIFADPFGNWLSTTNLPVNNASHVSTFEGGKVFVFGGANVDDFSDVLSSLHNIDGTLSGWTLVSNLPKTRYFGSLVKKENRVYIIGGATFPGFQIIENNVYSATIDDAGVVSSWEELTPLPANRAVGGAVIVGSRIYYAGGFDNSSAAQDEIYYTDINPDGTLGAWTTSSVLLPEPLYGFGMVEHNNNLIVFGGYNGSIYSNKTYKASVNPDGTISAFTETSALPEAVYRSAYVKVGSTIISTGGYNGFVHLGKVYYANINPNGTLDSWQQSANNLPQALQAAAASYANGFMYVTGGFNGAYLDTVYYAPVNISEGIDLPVPLLKQTNPLWGGFTYDSADEWAPPEPTDIARWGCALTSAAMVFQYHKITKLPNGIDLTPGTLNVWLKNYTTFDPEADGYIRNGLVNWLALSRLSKLVAPNNSGFLYDALEYRRVNGENKPQLVQDLGDGIPGILEEPGHFLVGRGTNLDTFNINDPFYDRNTLNDEYGNTFLSLGRFIPSSTDLSYIMLVVNEEVDINVSSSSGDLVGESFVQQPLENEETPGDFSGDPLRIFYLPDPSGGDYELELSSSSNNNYNLDVYYYDIDGNIHIDYFSGIVGPGDEDSYSIAFDKNNSDNSTSTQVVTFDSLINDIHSLYGLGEINFPNRVLLLTQAKVAKRLAGNNLTKKVSVKILKAMKKAIAKQKGRGLSDNAYNILHNDIQALLSSI